MYGSDATSAELHSEQAFESAWNVAETAILAVLFLVVIGGLLGVFGGGPLSHAQRRTPDDRTTVRYERILRASAATTVRISLIPENRTLIVELDKTLAGEVSGTIPRATEVSARPEGVAYRFVVEPGRPTEITFNTKAQTAGWFERQIGLLDETLLLPQAVLP